MLEVRNQQAHPLYNYKYDPEYEKIRKFELEKYLMRTKEKTEEEKNLIENLRRIEQVIRKEEREHQTLQKMLKEQIGEDNVYFIFILNKFIQTKDLFEEDCVKIVQTIQEQGKREINNPMESICYLRGKWLNEPLPIPEKMNKKLNIVLSELSVPNDFIATEANEQLFEDLRENIFIMFNYQKTKQKKEMVIKNNQMKKKIQKKKRKKYQKNYHYQTNNYKKAQVNYQKKEMFLLTNKIIKTNQIKKLNNDIIIFLLFKFYISKNFKYNFYFFQIKKQSFNFQINLYFFGFQKQNKNNQIFYNIFFLKKQKIIQIYKTIFFFFWFKQKNQIIEYIFQNLYFIISFQKYKKSIKLNQNTISYYHILYQLILKSEHKNARKCFNYPQYKNYIKNLNQNILYFFFNYFFQFLIYRFMWFIDINRCFFIQCKILLESPASEIQMIFLQTKAMLYNLLMHYFNKSF
ncbi:hypothetical protein IMG5_196340 [Ichthyophthirius multifiliis]|uniref:Uncharacterized protein n=1 Tax=Ichthyophthirius multifiliis TaxID=5932 RepID=G0R549_ICHMU|nr:hypothetical protein IMG5_196340 [Ichthyophthirius multifiliis]EGR27451.1 hypothetical protein IMG5_196340 [Ichthyophthirius multifiliis]|eukprot:XP_004024361.1 hypothetical protein IMG5_196340 [Ichthyophthirius multifiliis]